MTAVRVEALSGWEHVALEQALRHYLGTGLVHTGQGKDLLAKLEKARKVRLVFEKESES
jgi:hypothetical protein